MSYNLGFSYELRKQKLTLCEKCPNTEFFFLSVFSRIRTEYGEILCIQSEYEKIRTRKNSVFGCFSRSVTSKIKHKLYCLVSTPVFFTSLDEIDFCS